MPYLPKKLKSGFLQQVNKVWLVRRMECRANTLMEQKVVGTVFFGAVVTSPTTARCSEM